MPFKRQNSKATENRRFFHPNHALIVTTATTATVSISVIGGSITVACATCRTYAAARTDSRKGNPVAANDKAVTTVGIGVPIVRACRIVAVIAALIATAPITATAAAIIHNAQVTAGITANSLPTVTVPARITGSRTIGSRRIVVAVTRITHIAHSISSPSCVFEAKPHITVYANGQKTATVSK